MSPVESDRPTAAVFGCGGTELTGDERRFFAETRPFGFILFARNIRTPDQVRALIGSMRAAAGRDDAPVLVDQEGGRVARLKPPHWPVYPPAATYARLAARDLEAAETAVRLGARLIANDLAPLGFTVDCAPVLDVPARDGHEIIGDRAYGDTPHLVARLGRAACEGFLAGGILPIIKHIPGHGRATADSHLELPRVDAPIADLRAVDFAPFKALADMPCGMTAHVLFTAIDPERPATTSAAAIRTVIRGEIAFDGLLFSDDLSMQALSGTVAERAAGALAAGCDVALHCNGDLDEARAVAAVAGPMTDAARRRWAAARARLHSPDALDPDAARARLDELLGETA